METEMAGELTFIELGTDDVARARAFYERLFGWSFEPSPFGRGFAIDLPNVRGGLHGGDRGASPYVFFAVDDLEAACDRVRELGGQIEEIDVDESEDSTETFGRFKFCRDDQGSPFGLHQPPG
jgi:predicted enzyme related to lactoylglutathione lyase